MRFDLLESAFVIQPTDVVLKVVQLRHQSIEVAIGQVQIQFLLDESDDLMPLVRLGSIHQRISR